VGVDVVHLGREFVYRLHRDVGRRYFAPNATWGQA
jgi:hypothetical protein